MNQLLIAYWACAGLGFVYIVGSALLGHLENDDGPDADAEGDPGDMDADIDIDGGDPGDVDADLDVDSADPGDVDVDGSSQHNAHAARAIQEATAAGTVSKSRTHSLNWYFKALSLFSPTKLAIFLFFFGATGVSILQFLPGLGHITLIPAIIIGWALGKVLLNLLSKFVSGLHSSTNFKQESLVGTVGELILSIEPGKTGEILVSTRGARHNAPARAKDPNMAIKNLSKVIICDQANGVFLVEPLKDEVE